MLLDGVNGFVDDDVDDVLWRSSAHVDVDIASAVVSVCLVRHDGFNCDNKFDYKTLQYTMSELMRYNVGELNCEKIKRWPE
eukprot:scaffold3218_cov82-Skeletonema_dohrnii-CCMP3373.AAC.1